jgi:hypothetical protein
MSSPIFNDIAIPCFDLTWVELPLKKDGKTVSFAFVAGGGGNKTKSGVLNKIVSSTRGSIALIHAMQMYVYVYHSPHFAVCVAQVVFKLVGEAGVEEASSIDCQHGLCENLCTAVISVYMCMQQLTFYTFHSPSYTLLNIDVLFECVCVRTAC